MLPFFAFMHLHLASYLGMLDVPRVDVKHGMLEPNPKMVFGGPIPKMEGPLEYMLRVEIFPRRCKLTELTLCWIPSKPQSILNLLCFTNINLSHFMFDALGYRS